MASGRKRIRSTEGSNAQASEVEVYLCHRCDSYQTNKFSYLLKHLQDVHSSEPSFTVRCGIANCEKTYTKLNSYLCHIRRVHGYAQVPDEVQHIGDVVNTIGNTVDAQPVPNEDISETISDTSNETIQRNLAIMILKWCEKYQLPKTCLNNLLEDVSVIVSTHQREQLNKVKQCLQASDINVDEIPALQELLNEITSKSVFESLQTEAKQLSYFKSNFYLVEPIELVIGQDERGKEETFQYIPILDTIKSLLQHEDIFAQVMNSHETCQDGVLSNYCDGKFYKTNRLFNSDVKTLQVCLYNDDFEVCNPIGTFRKKQKLNSMYFFLGNIEPKYRSKLHVIQLAWLCKTIYVQKYGFAKLSEYLIRDLQVLEEEGISIWRNNCLYQFKGTVSMIVADNLGSHSIGGYFESFTANRICRFCMCTYKNLKELHLKTDFLHRSEELYNRHLELIQNDQSLSSVYGIKQECRFNSLSFFHVTTGLPSDPMHDLLEGVCPLVWSKVLSHFIHTNKIHLSSFNQRLALFEHKGSDKNKKPTPLSWASGTVAIKQTAAQMSCFMRTALYLLGDIIPERDTHWQLLLYLAGICELTFAPVHNVQSLSYLHGLVKDFLELYLDIFRNGLTPKMHFLTHYGEHIANFGPLSACSCMRFESKHGYFKKLARKTMNMKNLAMTLARRHQLLQCFYSTSAFFLEESNTTSTGGNVVDISCYEEKVKHAIQNGLNLGPQQQVFRAESVTINGVTYHKKAVLITGYDDTFLQFSLISGIFLKSGKTYFLVSQLDTLYFSEHYHTYVVKPHPHGLYVLLQVHDLLDPLPLQFCICKVGMCVATKYRLLSEFT